MSDEKPDAVGAYERSAKAYQDRYPYRARGPRGIASGRTTAIAWEKRTEAEAWCLKQHETYAVEVIDGIACPECGASVRVTFAHTALAHGFTANIESHKIRPGGPECRAFVRQWEAP